MRVLVAGATGLIGRRLCAALLDRGYSVIGASRSPNGLPRGASFLEVDFSSVPPEAWWTERLAGVEIVVNAVGILRAGRGQDFDALHARAPCELFRACAGSGVRLVIQISALGSDAQAASAYHLSKRTGDDCLRSLPVPSVIVQPSLVYAPDGPSATLFQSLAALPALPLPAGGPLVQPVHVDDVIEGLLRLVEQPGTGTRTLAFVGPAPLPIDGYLAELRRAMDFRRRAVVIPVPHGLCLAAGRAAGWVSTVIDRDAVAMLLRGNAADAGAFTSLLDRPPRPPATFMDGAAAPAARTQAVLHWLLPPLRWTIAFVWIWTALMSFGLYPIEGSLALLDDFGLSGRPAMAALFAGAAIDLVLGILILLPGSRDRGWLWAAQFAVILGYTLMITVRMPHWWLHPYGPLSKNLPMLAGIAMAWALESRRR
ncbi:SDR family oxidoreductase [Caenimonas sedimenti]|uniref:SDR family oxidoreductase n=1 Tax=Caenimonas sedimenti TaxID=2596921 RepID=A0A562ZW83_9BURK|nr:SDR family oxidoreductase [Caenimonas sedimenti]TWO72879.1 SDR family oxidoreductase [Caenimonas sedimenti]